MSNADNAAARRVDPAEFTAKFQNLVQSPLRAGILRFLTARPGETFPLNPWDGRPIPGWLTLGGWLAGARHWHFAGMWLLVAWGAWVDRHRSPAPATA